MIKTLLFDFGDVFLTLDKSATLRELQKLGMTGFTPEMILFLQEYEKGHLSSQQFIAQFREWFPGISENQLIRTWNAILMDFPPSRMKFIKEVPASVSTQKGEISEEKKYQLILLSNTNDLHIEWVSKHIAFFESFKACFDAFYLSHEINFRKPDPTIFEFVMKKHRLKPNETLFVDDTAENTETAQKLGFHVWNLDPEQEDVTELFSKKANLFNV